MGLNPRLLIVAHANQYITIAYRPSKIKRQNVFFINVSTESEHIHRVRLVGSPIREREPSLFVFDEVDQTNETGAQKELVTSF